MLASPVYSWILYDVYGKNALADYSSILYEPIKTEKVLLVADPHFIYDIDRGPELRDVVSRISIRSPIGQQSFTGRSTYCPAAGYA